MKSVMLCLMMLTMLSGCANYFSDYKTVYRINTKNGERYYSANEPKLDDDGVYRIKDLDGNIFHIDKAQWFKMEKFRHKK